MDMRDYIRIITEGAAAKTRIDRSAFLYLEPQGSNKKEFAQCSTCAAYKPFTKRCSLFSSKDYVKPEASCGLYLKGKPSEDQETSSMITPKEAGYMEGKVRCENCRSFADGKCAVFAQLNELLPNTFDLDANVKPLACCNAFQPL